MLLIYVITLLLVFWNIKKRPEASMESALSVEQTTMIKGIFVLLIFASHVSQYLDLSQSSDLLTRGYSVIRNKLGQLIVAPFLFYSGYGIHILDALYYLTESRISAVKVGCILVHNEELASCRVGVAGSGHRKDSSGMF